MSERASIANDLAQSLAQRFGQEPTIPPSVDIEQLSALARLARRASHRAWASSPVSTELVELLVACALCAPTKSYLQQTDIVDVRDADKRRRLGELMPSLPWLGDAPVLLIFCGNGRRLKRMFERADVTFPNDHLDAFFNPTVDASLVLMACLQAAEAVGLVGCPISLVRNQPAELSELLELPKRIFPVAGLCLGYPKQHRNPTPRLSLRSTLHVDRIGDGDQGARDDAAVAEFDQRYIASRAAFANIASPKTWSQEKVEQNSVPQRTDWGAYVRMQKFDLG